MSFDYDAAKATLRSAAEAYYRDGSSDMTDADFDRLLAEVVEYEAIHGLTDDTVAGTIGAGAKMVGTVKHSTPMLSLDNVFSETAVDAWLAANRIDTGSLVTEPKLDGMAMAVHYDNGTPVRMLTRGDGTTGEDVSAAMPLLSNLPSKVGVPSNPLTRDLRPFTGEVRGEVIFSADQFVAANGARVAAGGTEFANARNAAAGTVNRASKGGAVPDGTELSFIVYDVVDKMGHRTHSSVMDLLSKSGFTTALSLFNGVKAPLTAKPQVGFELDGLVFKVDDLARQAELGFTSRAPRWARAFKYPPDVARTKLVDVLWQVGRTGSVTPRAVVQPVKVGGTTVTYATLNNPHDIARKGLLLGDTIEVRRAAEVIPEITGPVVSMRTGGEVTIPIPATCPNCGETLDDSQARLRCPSGGECALDRKLVYAASRDALDIEGLSTAMVEAGIAAGVFGKLEDIFAVSESQLATLPTGRTTDRGAPIAFGDAVAKKVKAEIERARAEATFERVLIALGLTGTGRSMSKRIAAHFGSMDDILAATADDFTQVDKVGKVKAESLYRQLHEPDMLDTIDALAAAGLPMEVAATTGPQPLAGQTIVVTGPMRTLGSRSEVTGNLEKLGATVGSSVGSKTTLVVADDPDGTSSKLVKARKLGVRIVDEETFVTEFGL